MMEDNDAVGTSETKLPRRRLHSDAFKAEVVAAARRPNASTNAVAKRYRLSPSLVRGWIRKALASAAAPGKTQVAPPAGFVALPMSHAAPLVADIQIEVRRGAAVVNVRWPAAASADCAAWLQGWLR
ncbi:hypothetical protein D9M68_910610 [compost metagenome]